MIRISGKEVEFMEESSKGQLCRGTYSLNCASTLNQYCDILSSSFMGIFPLVLEIWLNMVQ